MKNIWQHARLEQSHFAVYTGSKRYDATTLSFVGQEDRPAKAGVAYTVSRYAKDGLEVEHHTKTYEGTALSEVWQTVRNTAKETLEVSRIDSFVWDIPPGDYKLLYYSGNWGSEFEGIEVALSEPLIVETTTGRSSKGHHPWFALSSGAATLSGSLAWSGNWAFRFEPLPEGGFRLSGGIHDWGFSKRLTPGDEMTSPPMIRVTGVDLNSVSQQYARLGRKHWYPRTSLSSLPPVEWNHWWSYEDDHINERVYRDNVTVAAEMGVDVCVLDAGWFGPSDPGTFWEHYRGDWHNVNTARFPNGLRPIADEVHARGMKFGLWCEIEAIGPKAEIATMRPELVATRNGERLGYICLGSAGGRQWAYETLSRLIREHDLDWIKLDFNLDPGAGCNRTDHGHGEGDGLYEHYQGYYGLLERVRADFPEVTLESCSSGGLRIDLGLLRRTDMTFLSDPDWPVHDLQLFWGASTMLAPDSILHWSFGDWVHKTPPPQQTFKPHDPNLTKEQLDYYTRISMLNVFGISQRLPDLPDWVRERLTYHTRIYKDEVRRFVREADLYRLSSQPKRDGSGERWCAFQYSLPDGLEHLLFVFRMPGSKDTWTAFPQGLDLTRKYRIGGFENETFPIRSGAELMEQGLTLSGLPPESSWLLKLSSK